MIMGVSVARKRQHQRGSTAATRTPASLGIVGGRRRYVAHVNRGEILYVDPQLHGRRAEEDGQPTIVERPFALFALLG